MASLSFSLFGRSLCIDAAALLFRSCSSEACVDGSINPEKEQLCKTE